MVYGLSMYTKIRELIYSIKTYVPVTNATVWQLLVPAQDAGSVKHTAYKISLQGVNPYFQTS